MLLEYLAYEGTSTVLSWCGIKVLLGTNVKKMRVNQLKPLPFIDNYLKGQLGLLATKEKWLAKKIVFTINKITTYNAFNLLIALGLRRMHEKQIRKIGTCTPGTRRIDSRSNLAA